MQMTKTGKILTLTLTDEENEAVEYLIKSRGNKGFMNGIQAWMDTRVATVRDENRRLAVSKMTKEEIKQIIERPRFNPPE